MKKSLYLFIGFVFLLMCSACGGTTNPCQHGHSYTKYESNKDGTHTKICEHDSNHTENEDCHFGDWEIVLDSGLFTEGVKVRSCKECGYIETQKIDPTHQHYYSTEWTIDVEPTCSEPGSKSHHCTKDNCTSKTDETEIPPIEHEYGEASYYWNSTFTEVVAKRVCVHDETHVETETVQATYEVITHATCEEVGLGRYTTNAFTNSAFTVQTYDIKIDKIDHVYSTEWTIDVDPTCTGPGSKSHHCTNENCTSKTDITLIPAIKHEYGEVTYTWNETYTEVVAKRICIHDETHVETETVQATYEVITPSTCAEVGVGRYTTNEFSNKVFEVQTHDVELKELGHNYSTEWTIDIEPTYTEPGSKSHHCTNDNCTSKINETTIPILYSEGLKYTYDEVNEGYIIIGIGSFNGNILNINPVYNGFPVTTIGERAFYNCDSLTSIRIPDSVTTIGDSAFYFCDNLTSITIGNSVTTIGDSAFSCCDNLKSITIPDSVTTIGERVFSYCTDLTVIEVDSNNLYYKAIEGNLYTKDGSILIQYANGKINTPFVIPDSVTTIGDYAFYSCDSLTSITIPDSVTTIGDYAFYSCDNLKSITIPDSVTTIGERAFSYCTDLTSITIPDSVTTIGDYAFLKCDNLTSITIPDSVTTIGDYAFFSCDNLISITIPDSVTTIGDGAFSSCTDLTIIVVDSSNLYYKAIEGNLYTKDGTKLLQYANGKINTSFVIPDSVTTIGVGAFRSCTSLASITIPDSVTTIGVDAFRSCTSLASITIPDSVTTIGDYAFQDCYKLTSIIIGDSVTTIGDYAFQYCYNLTSITVGDSVTTIGDYAFQDCYKLTSIIIPDSVTTIGDYAFRYCYKLTSITIPDSVTTIGVGAFSSCSSLTSITIPDSVTTIGDYAFQYCDKLTSITIPDSVTIIGVGAFTSCKKLTSITIPDSVTTIGERAFQFCTNLTSITIPDSVTTIGERAFLNCDNLTSITIPDSVTTIRDDAFSDCDKLIIYCEAKSLPSGWSNRWNASNRPVIWGYSE